MARQSGAETIKKEEDTDGARAFIQTLEIYRCYSSHQFLEKGELDTYNMFSENNVIKRKTATCSTL